MGSMTFEQFMLEDLAPRKAKSVDKVKPRYKPKDRKEITQAAKDGVDITNWDVSEITDMSFLFQDLTDFNQDLSNWDTSNVTNMGYMFYGCEKLRSIPKNFNTSNVNNMEYMFRDCKEFNQDISHWNVSKVLIHDHMFDDCPIREEYKPKFKED
jgi:surface protein